MSLLESLVSPTKRPLIVTIVGEGGMGKTTLASLFPSPVFIRTEDGTQSIAHRQDVALFPVAEDSYAVLRALEALLKEDHPFKTVVIDSITKMNTMIETEIVSADGKAKSINQAGGGYGAGHSQVAAVHGQVRHLAGYLSAKKGMHVVFIAHAESEQIDPPDMDPYTRYSLRLNKKSVSHYVDDVDLVGFVKMRTLLTGKEDRYKATTTGERIITCYPTPSHVSKNRFGITKDLPFDGKINPFKELI